MEYSVKIYSRIGELMQGFLPDASNFLVSGLPSRLFFSEAVLDPRGVPNVVPKGKTCQGALPPKARKALALFLQEFAPVITPGLSIRLQSNIPAGKGLSSSSADILSVLYVVNDYLQIQARAEDMYRIAAAIEPTDPCLSEDIVLFRQRQGVVDRYLSLPPLSILYFDADPARQIETMRVKRQWSNGVGTFFGWLLKRFLGAAEAGDYVRLFDCVSYSAEYNQREIAIPRFGEWFGLARETHSALMVAHSGTIAGLLTRPEQAAGLRARLESSLDTPVYFEEYRQT
ncbi:MAG: hypothetical protein JST42_20290 [Bacteroidetes bacterium]|nr:hypothetical protein [Bacteroidota bacterium]